LNLAGSRKGLSRNETRKEDGFSAQHAILAHWQNRRKERTKTHQSSGACASRDLDSAAD